MPPKKKKAADASADAQPAKAAKKAATDTAPAVAAAPAKPVGKVAVDSHFFGGGEVYQEGGINWAVTLNQTNIGQNNNKFYVVQLINNNGNYTTFTRWGRVGEPGQQASFACNGNLAGAKAQFCSKFKDKTKNDWNKVQNDPASFVPASGKYTLVETATEDAGDAVAVTTTEGRPVATKATTLHKALQETLGIIFDKDMFKQTMQSFNLDATKMPLGKLTKAQVQKGYEALAEIEDAVKASKTSKLADLSSKFYTVIPHSFGRSVPPAIKTDEQVKKKYELLNVLNDIQIACSVDAAAQGGNAEEHPLDKQYKELGCTIEYVEPSSEEFKTINTYTVNTQGYRKCKIVHVFRVDRPQDKERMEAYKSMGNRHLLWHGTNVAVVAAILKSGLRIMPHAGGRVGKGLYFASENGKSAGYVQCDKNRGFMFLNEVVMGNAKEINQDDWQLDKAKVADVHKADSIIARGRTEPDPAKMVTMKGEWGDISVPQGNPIPQAKWSNSTFAQSEYLVYDEGRARIKYILQMDFS